MRGTGLGNAAFSGIRGGAAVAKFVADQTGEVKIDPEQVKTLRENMFAPKNRTSDIDAPQLVRAIQDVMSPAGNSIYLHKDRMQAALGRILEIKAQVPQLAAKDWHYLAACNEVRSMVLSAEMFFRACLPREESRGWFIREDFPETDNANWLKWIVVQDNQGEMAISTEDVPIDDYPVKP
jgi:succinate dehydrogenase/fumarate reductase flavoprotein subunit